MHNELFIQYINNLIIFYKQVSNNIYVRSINLFQEMIYNYDNNHDIMLLKPTISKIDNIDVLIQLLSFFIGKHFSIQLIYSN